MEESRMNLSVTAEDQIIEMDIDRLHDFKNHPFRVETDANMLELKDSIEKYGILTPILVRPVLEGYYEIISGHRRKYAAKQLGYRKVPVIIRILKDDEAVVAMVDSNFQREYILPSEKAFAYHQCISGIYIGIDSSTSGLSSSKRIATVVEDYFYGKDETEQTTAD